MRDKQQEGRVMNYDPNLTLCGRMADQKVRLTFGQWDYRATVEEIVGGNCTGLTVIDCAVANAYEALPSKEYFDEAVPCIRLSRGDDVLDCVDDEMRGEHWLKDMLISAEIIDIQPETAHD